MTSKKGDAVAVRERRTAAQPSSRQFEAKTIDDDRELLQQGYALRYQVYCLERKFLPAAEYPGQLEMDEFDAHSVHVGAVDSAGTLAGTARAVKMGEAGLPVLAHCTLFPHAAVSLRRGATLVEVGRLSVSRSYSRRAADRRNGSESVFLTLSKALYQASKRMGATHWLAATERSLQRMLARHGFPFRPIGPESDYFGPVVPYRLDLTELDSAILSDRFPGLQGFAAGLEPEYRPRPGKLHVAGPSTRFGSIAVIPQGGEADDVGIEAPVVERAVEHRLLTEFWRAAALVPGYRTLLAEHGVRSEEIHDVTSFSRSCPLMSKDTFDRFPLDQLSVGGQLGEMADVITSSGHGGRFSFGIISRRQEAASAAFIDEAFDVAFHVKSRSTLAINCLPMGVVFSSHRMTVATTSVREDMAVALVLAFGHHYDQIVLVGDPLFLKRFTDYARAKGVDWKRYRVNAVVGEEIFGEHFRGYLASCIGLHGDQPGDGFIMSSFGVAELGLHLCYETPATVALRRMSFRDHAFANELLGVGEADGSQLPMIFTFDPMRTFIEVVRPDCQGYGRLTISMLDPERTVPLLRYQTGDVVRVLDPATVAGLVGRYRMTLPQGMPPAILALRGRESEALPNGSHVGFYKDALYADPEIARLLTGAFRLVFTGRSCVMHVQLIPSPAFHRSLEAGLLQTLPPSLRPAHLVVWPYATFPFGMSLDYAQKFVYYVHGEPDPAAA